MAIQGNAGQMRRNYPHIRPKAAISSEMASNFHFSDFFNTVLDAPQPLLVAVDDGHAVFHDLLTAAHCQSFHILSFSSYSSLVAALNIADYARGLRDANQPHNGRIQCPQGRHSGRGRGQRQLSTLGVDTDPILPARAA